MLVSASHREKEMVLYPVSQDGRSNVRSGTDDTIGRFWFGLDHDWWRYLVSPALPILVEIEDDELPFNPIANSAANDLLPRRDLRGTKADYKA